MGEIRIGDTAIALGESKTANLFVARLYDYTDVSIPIRVIRGREDGPVLFVSAALHGDELNGVEIIKRLLRSPSLKKICGTLIAVPIVNVFGFNNRSRYLPDRRDLNRSFPGRDDGSLASQIAYLFRTEVVEKCTHGLDLHTGALHRTNLPQIRTNFQDKELVKLAKAFGAPVVLDASLPDGSLRATSGKVPVLLYEGGEALRFDEFAIKAGLAGTIRLMRHLKMLPPSTKPKPTRRSFLAQSSYWVRAPQSGTLRVLRHIGDWVRKDSLLGVISNPFGEDSVKIFSKEAGVVIGKTNIPLVNRGDALFHLATADKIDPRIMDFPGFADLAVEQQFDD
ncbi:MAG: succinylglutamate desuccinylase/aspartoacylase family protein [Bdellovibrionaceae bacterium]|nr:succinylglutamate desuccinylase/aspartoacylase family protein [Bdellovibrionales bacterium]MCB9254482.1 succinylglutamate desuccinylase/aspartoacylase family protein [Pseudobdellovibrionaceae bacterium]